MTAEILSGQPPQPGDKALIEAYHQAIIKQADRYDDLAKELLKLELAIPGIYAAALKLVSDQPPDIRLVAAAFGLWALALVATLHALLPRRYQVRHNAVQSVEDFFRQSAEDKRRDLLWSVPLFFGGIVMAALAAVLI